MYRNTYVEINLDNIKYNVKNFINKHPNYKYYFGVVKADSYAHNSIETVKSIIDGGCNYLAVSNLDEAIKIRNYINGIPILCLGIIDLKYISKCIDNNITVTISNFDYLKKLLSLNISNLKVHIKVNTGMNRLGFNDINEITSAFNLISESNLILEGIYTHIYNSSDSCQTNLQYSKFEELTRNIDLSKISIIHLGASDATISYKKRKYANGCRLGIAMYGLMDNYDNSYKSTFSLYSEVIQINEIENETIGYGGFYKANELEKIAVVSIGYADGIIRKNTGRYVYINDCKYKIVGNICMDMLFVKVDDKVKVGDKVTIIKDIEHIREISKHLDTITYEVICSIGKRVPRIYK